ncbi:MAG: DUF4908 domain-containing protein [Maricaulaceae bacterium]|nr:DUF4908 domain-containing protein [Maricaulaceae bacterium]
MNALVLALFGLWLVAEAQNPDDDNPLRRRLLAASAEMHAAVIFERIDGLPGFILDRSGEPPLFAPGDQAEVFVLSARRGPGGGTSLVNDAGREILRFSPTGGATYYPGDAPNGVIVESVRVTAVLRPPARTEDDVRQSAARAATELRRTFNRPVSVEYGPVPIEGLGVLNDAIALSVEGASQAVARDAPAAGRLELIRISTGRGPDAIMNGRTLEIVIDPLEGYAGRPSSEKILQAILRADMT